MWFFPCVRLLVSFETIGTEEALVTLCTGVRADSCVIAQVNGQVARLCEFLATVGTLKGLVARVETLMFQKLSVGKETFPAVGA